MVNLRRVRWDIPFGTRLVHIVPPQTIIDRHLVETESDFTPKQQLRDFRHSSSIETVEVVLLIPLGFL